MTRAKNEVKDPKAEMKLKAAIMKKRQKVFGRLYGFQNTLFKNPKHTGLSEEETMDLWEEVNKIGERTKVTESLEELDKLYENLVLYMENYKTLVQKKSEDTNILFENLTAAKTFNDDLYAVRERFINAKVMQEEEKDQDLRVVLT